MTKPTIGLGILSWKSHETLLNTLQSFQKENFLSLFDHAVIYFSDISEEDKKIAKDFSFEAKGGKNRGIAVGTEALARAVDADYLLLLQNDNPLIEPFSFAQEHLREALFLLEKKKVQLVRMRHQWLVGEGFSDVEKYLKYFPVRSRHPEFIPSEHSLEKARYHDTAGKRIRRMFRPLKTHQMTGRSIYIEKHPEITFPRVIQKEGDFLIIDSSVLVFSDQCLLISKDFFLNVLMDYVTKHPTTRTCNGYQVPEICLNSRWWRKQNFKIGQGRGLFTHNRFDR